MKKLLTVLLSSLVLFAHPMGNFSVSHFSQLQLTPHGVELRYVLDLAEIPTFELLRAWQIDRSAPARELNLSASRQAREWLQHLDLTTDGHPVKAAFESVRATIIDGAGNLPILRMDMRAHVNTRGGILEFEDRNYPERAGWKEIVVLAVNGALVKQVSQSDKSLSQALTKYPPDPTIAPPQDLRARVDWTITPPVVLARTLANPPVAQSPIQPKQSTVSLIPQPHHAIVSAAAPASMTAQGAPAGSIVRGDLLSRLLHRSDLSLFVMLIGLAAAFGLGAFHALTPGHGKAVVAAYLVGSRGTPKHAVFLGLTVTATHTAGVFALGLLTLFASRYILPERLFPVLSLVSGALVAFIGFTLLFRRLSLALGVGQAHLHPHIHSQADGDPTDTHVHFPGDTPHSHLPPGSNGEAVSWRGLLALGISGGLLPCPSALIVLLSAVALHRVAYGLLLVLAFSFGLAATLTSIGLAFVYAGRWLSRFASFSGASQLRRFLPVLSALVVACLGLGISYEAAEQVGFHPALLLAQWGAVASGHTPLSSMGALAVLGFGLILGFKHATEADHVIAVSSIVSEHRKISKVAIIGALWGAGHTLTLVLVGCVVLLLRVAIPEHVANVLEFGVAVMIIGLSGTALARALRGRSDIHAHRHAHGGSEHMHLHFHDEPSADHPAVDHEIHRVSRVGLKPLLVGAMHGLAGSAALTLLVLTQVSSVSLGLGYLLIFGTGSILGMMMVSVVIGLPFALSARHLAGATLRLQALAGIVGVSFGCWYAFNTGSAFF